MKPLYLLPGCYVSLPQVLLPRCLGRLQNELWGHLSVLENSAKLFRVLKTRADCELQKTLMTRSDGNETTDEIQLR